MKKLGNVGKSMNIELSNDYSSGFIKLEATIISIVYNARYKIGKRAITIYLENRRIYEVLKSFKSIKYLMLLSFMKISTLFQVI